MQSLSEGGALGTRCTPGSSREQGGKEGRTQVRPGSVLGALLGPWPQPLRPLAMDPTVPDLFPKPRAFSPQ